MKIPTHAQDTRVKGVENLNRVTSDRLPRDRGDARRQPNAHLPDNRPKEVDQGGYREAGIV